MRYVPTTESLQTRYKADPAGLEGVAWFCDGCGTEIAREEWDTSERLLAGGVLASLPGRSTPASTDAPAPAAARSILRST